MRKLVLSFLVLTYSLLAGEVTQTYTIDSYSIEKRGDYTFFSTPNSISRGKLGEPSLPFTPVMILLEPGEEATSIDINYADPVTIPEKILLQPQQAVQPISSEKKAPFSFNSNIYKTNSFYSARNHKFSTHFKNGYAIARSAFSPMKYNPVTRELVYYKTVTVRMTTTKTEKAQKALSMLSPSEHVKKVVTELVDNPAILNSYPTVKPTKDDYQMLILTAGPFTESFDELVKYYKTQNIKVEIKDVAKLRTAGRDLPEQIRNTIIEEYKSRHIEYVLLGGDIEHVPFRGFYCHVISGNGYTDNNIPSDIYFSALDGDFNKNGNNLYGEVGKDDVDDLPEIAVGRLPFSNPMELENMLHKTLSYQQNPVQGENTIPLLAGESLDALTPGGDALDCLIGEKSDNGYTTSGITEDNTITKLYDKTGKWGKDKLTSLINKGTSFIYHVGHSKASSNMRYSTRDITDSRFSSVDGKQHNYALINTIGCICGAFDKECIGEAYVKIKNLAVAFVGNSRYGWYNNETSDGPSTHLQREFVHGIYKEGISRIGKTHSYSKVKTSKFLDLPEEFEPGAQRWCFYDCNLLGDPALNIWYKAGQVPVTHSSNNIQMNTLSVKKVHQNFVVSVQISSIQSQNLTVSLVNGKGQKLFTETKSVKKGVNNVSFSVNGKNFAKGTYFLQIKQGNLVQTKLLSNL